MMNEPTALESALRGEIAVLKELVGLQNILLEARSYQLRVLNEQFVQAILSSGGKLPMIDGIYDFFDEYIVEYGDGCVFLTRKGEK